MKNIRSKDVFGGRAKKIRLQKMLGVVQKKYAPSNAGGRAKKSPIGSQKSGIGNYD
jgi:hypothetical protein